METIRYYEKQGLIAPTHQQNGYRVFDENQLEQLRFIKTCRNIGLSLSNIKTLLQLQQTPNKQCNEINALAEQHLAYLDEQIKELQQVKTFLMQFVGVKIKRLISVRLFKVLKKKNSGIFFRQPETFFPLWV
ncbi:MerR family DNA-binding protein [Haemophilus influenzae]